MSTWDLLRELPLEIEGIALDGRELKFSEEFSRLTTRVLLRGKGEDGVGEDVTYDGLDQVTYQTDGASLPVTGSWTLESFAAHLDAADLWFGHPPSRQMSYDFRRWGLESAALDLALRQAGKPLHEVLGREPRPVTYVVSMRLKPFGVEGPEKPDRMLGVLERYPNTRFKLDATNDWTQELCDRLRETGAVDSIDLKGFYRDTPVDVRTDPELYRMVVDTFPDAWIEDPDITDETRPVLEPHWDRITWDAPIHSVRDVEMLERKPRTVNIKPSRFGRVQELCTAYDYCDREGIGAYGGGQTELAEGRGQIQYLASLFHPDTPNDVAPGGFNMPETPDGLPETPLEPAPSATGFRWG
jgi:L-alanine-DL-glutamate epimerase-like enolase superfamily enzyme